MLNFAEGYYERPKHNQGGENHEDVQYTQKDKPSPDVIWQKDGVLSSCACSHVSHALQLCT